MKIINELPRLIECATKWTSQPTQTEFEKSYLKPLEHWLKPMLDDFHSYRGVDLYEHFTGLNWTEYRSHILKLDPAFEQQRLEHRINDIERLLETKLAGECVLFGSFFLMDGYARFDRGTHRVYLGVDEEHGRGAYLDILITHELTHVVRESKAAVWEGWGLSLGMDHDEFGLKQPALEHLANEGLACVVSELLNPGHDPWLFVYQTKDSFNKIVEASAGINRMIKHGLETQGFSYREFYDVDNYKPKVALFAHYVWAWAFAKSVLKNRYKGDIVHMVTDCSKDWLNDALHFELTEKVLVKASRG